MKRFARTALAVGLALASGTAAALGLGQIELKSKLGEPLLAEIPIISSDPAELERLRAGLASPETFARIGLRPPDSVVANLQFVSALDDRGNPVIRVTSVQPIEQPLLTFLVEVDWGQGKLVREYSALIDAPRTVSAPLQPPIEAPVAAPSNMIASEPAAVADAPEAVVDDTLESQPEPVDPQQAGTESSPDTAIEPTPEPAAAPRPVVSAPPPAPAARPGEYGAVRAGETLSEIAERLDFGASLDQSMIALLDANPDAFIDGNVNLLKQGAVLRVPDAAEVRGVDVAQAMARVREQTRAWRTARAPVPQPALAAEPAGATADAGSTAGDNPPDESATAAGGARLEIVPPGASGASQAGTQSGISAGAEGDMVRQEMQQTQETLAARNAELADLKSRVADLEKLQADQQKLLQMKDNELTAVQQRLAKAQSAEQDTGVPGLPWLLGGAGLLLLGLLGGWWMRRRAEVDTGGFRAPVSPGNPSPLAAGFPAAKPVATPRREPVMPDPAPAREAPASSPAAPVIPAAAAPTPSAPTPTWHAGSPKLNVPAPAPVEPSMADAEAPGRERLELARAYLDLGDRDSARQLLGEIAINGDHALRQQATQMLRELD
ncbi:FimV/HubP family polar landmark protein [Lysobacter sp. F6437]|uniref:FimV/HubP family polar landmark protein n=1 Tax=Lysobacter sp. F6437 TaxID=3459296 RepID=UPI00403D72AB